MSGPQIVVMAKEPLPGRVKTRLMPAFGAAGAAELALAALQDTLDAALGSTAAQVVLALDGRAGNWLPAGISVLPQRSGSLGTRLAGAIADAYRLAPLPVLVIGMDTPQITPALLDLALRQLDSPETDAVFGAAEDGGYWCLGLRHPDARVFDGVAMSTATTGHDQLQQLAALGLITAQVPALRDVDEPQDVTVVAREAPNTRFAVLAGLLAVRGAA